MEKSRWGPDGDFAREPIQRELWGETAWSAWRRSASADPKQRKRQKPVPRPRLRTVQISAPARSGQSRKHGRHCGIFTRADAHDVAQL